MSRVPPLDRCATYEDLLRLPDHLVGEIVGGELHANPRPAARLASSTIALGGILLRGLDRRASPDSWQVLPEPEVHLGADILVPRLAGWRLSRLPEAPATPYFSVAPNWVCEIPASYTASLRARKMAAYAGEGVSHAWLLDPVARTLDVLRLVDGRFVVLTTHVGEEVVRAEPFEELELPLALLWPRDSSAFPA